MTLFRRLKLKLTLINVTVLGIVIALLITGIYSLMILSTTGQAEEQMRLIAANAGSQRTTYMLRTEKYSPKEFYAKIDNKGKVFETSHNLPIAKDQLQVLVNKVLTQPKADTVTNEKNQEEFRFYKAPLTDAEGSIIVFLGTSLEKLYIGHLIAVLIIAGIVGIILTLFCSLFMANKALIPIQKSWETQKNFVGDASHELRTPLTVIQTNLEIVMDNPTETVENQLLWLENIQLETKLMSKLVDDLLFLARTNSPQTLINFDCFRLDLAIAEALQAFEPVAAQKNLALETSIDPEITFQGDSIRIKQLAAILVDNAIKYTPAGGKITVQLKKANNHIQLIVTDTGEGIGPEHQEKVFLRFYRVDKARSRDSGGTGLGLPIAEWIVKAHHGTIKLNSVLNQGTVVTVNLPK